MLINYVTFRRSQSGSKARSVSRHIINSVGNLAGWLLVMRYFLARHIHTFPIFPIRAFYWGTKIVTMSNKNICITWGKLKRAAQSVKLSFLARKLGHKFHSGYTIFLSHRPLARWAAPRWPMPDVFIANVQCIFVCLFIFIFIVFTFLLMFVQRLTELLLILLHS